MIDEVIGTKIPLIRVPQTYLTDYIFQGKNSQHLWILPRATTGLSHFSALDCDIGDEYLWHVINSISEDWVTHSLCPTQYAKEFHDLSKVPCHN